MVSTITVTITSAVPVTFTMYAKYGGSLFVDYTGTDGLVTTECNAVLLGIAAATTTYPRNASPLFQSCPPTTCPASWTPPVSYTFAPSGVPVYANDKSSAFWQATNADVPATLTQLESTGYGNIFFAPTLASGAAPVRCCVDMANVMSCSWTNPATPTYVATSIGRGYFSDDLQIANNYYYSPYPTISLVPLQTGSSVCYTNS